MTTEGKTTLRKRLEHPGTRTLAREELRRRILAIVERRGELSDGAIWQASAPDYLPWDFMLAEIRALHADRKLVLEIVAPGHWIVRSLAFSLAQQPQAKRAQAAGRPRRTAPETGARSAPPPGAASAPVQAADRARRKSGARSGSGR